MCNELGEELCFGQRPGLPDRADSRRLYAAHELCPISRSRSINSRGRELPGNVVILVVIQVDVTYQVPQGCKLEEVLSSEPDEDLRSSYCCKASEPHSIFSLKCIILESCPFQSLTDYLG